jgi:hypothetical protein
MRLFGNNWTCRLRELGESSDAQMKSHQEDPEPDGRCEARLVDGHAYDIRPQASPPAPRFLFRYREAHDAQPVPEDRFPSKPVLAADYQRACQLTPSEEHVRIRLNVALSDGKSPSVIKATLSTRSCSRAARLSDRTGLPTVLHVDDRGDIKLDLAYAGGLELHLEAPGYNDNGICWLAQPGEQYAFKPMVLYRERPFDVDVVGPHGELTVEHLTTLMNWRGLRFQQSDWGLFPRLPSGDCRFRDLGILGSTDLLQHFADPAPDEDCRLPPLEVGRGLDVRSRQPRSRFLFRFRRYSDLPLPEGG